MNKSVNNFFSNIQWSPVEYVESAIVARMAGEEMLSRLEWTTLQPKVVLDIGCGPREQSQQLQKRYPDAVLLALDASMNMLQHVQPQLTHGVCATAEVLPLRDQSVDLIFANFLLPWHQDMRVLLHEWRRVLSPNGLLMLTALGPGSLCECDAVLGVAELPLRIDMHDIGDVLLQTGFADPVLDVDPCQVTYRDVTRLIHELQASGICQLDAAAAQALQQHLRPNASGAYPISYEVIYAHAFTPLASQTYAADQSGAAAVPLSALRKRLRDAMGE